jgi:hypothetical protein
MATVKRTTTTTVQARRTTLPPLEQSPSRLGGRVDSPGQLPEGPPDNQWPDVPVDPESEIEGAPSEVVPVGVEQLERSQEMQAMGIANWVAAHDERTPEELESRSVQGVGPLER